MADGPSIRRRTLLQGGALAALGVVPSVGHAAERRTLADYANADGVVDATGLGDAARDFRTGLIGADLLNDVAVHWRSGDTVTDDSSANPARLIDSHVQTVENTDFELTIDEYEGEAIGEPSKEIVFEWDHDQTISRVIEHSRGDSDGNVDLSQLFTMGQQHVDIAFENEPQNEATLSIDDGPVYIDASSVLDRLLIGASLSFDTEVPVGETTLPRYEIESHRRLTDASGHVVGDEDAYIAELEIQWTTPADERATITINTNPDHALEGTTYGSFESAPSSESNGSMTTADHDTALTIVEPTPSESTALEYGSTETFECRVEYDLGTESPGYLSVSVREEEWGSIGEYVELDEQSGTVDVSHTRTIGDEWEQARFIINLYGDADGCPGSGCVNTVVASDEVVYELTDNATGGSDESLPDLVVHDVAWSPSEPSPGEPVEFSVEVENTGDAPAETIETRVFVDGELAHVPPTIDLDPGERRWTVETGNQSFDAGEYTARAVIDPDENISEESQSNNELERTLTVGSGEATIDATIDWIDIDDGTYQPGESVSGSISVENTGDTTYSFWVDFSAEEPNEGWSVGEGATIKLSPGERQTLQLTWTVPEDAETGLYNGGMGVYESDDKNQKLDGETEFDAFEVEQPTAEAEILGLDIDGGTYTIGEAVETTVSVKNTGTATHTYFVGYTVYGPGGDSYDNDGETGRTVTLDPGESTPVDVEWTVEDDAADGSYDVEVAVWEERDRDSLYTRLDSVEEFDQFTVDATEALPDLTVSAIDWMPSTPEVSDEVTFSITIANEGQSRATDIDTEATVGSDRFSDTISWLGAGDQRVVELGDWTAVSGSSTVTVVVDPSDDIEEADEYKNTMAETIFVEESESQVDIEIRSTVPESDRYRRGDRATITTELVNVGDTATVDVEHRLISPEGTTQVDTTTRTISTDTTASVTATWDLTDQHPTGSYDVIVSVTEPDTGAVLRERTAREVFEVATEPRNTNLTIETVDQNGTPLDGVVVTLEANDGGRSLSDTSSDGTVVFEDVDTGRYSLTAESNQRYQELDGEVVLDGEDAPVRQLRFDRAEPIQGIVLDTDGDQVIPGATVTIPDLPLATQTDDSGRFEFEEQLPDGSYEFEIQADGSRSSALETATDESVVRTKTVGINRSITLSVPFETTSGDDDPSELLSEEDLFVSLLVRNLERTDLALPAQISIVQQYGMVKGVVAALSDFVDSIRDLLNMDLSEMVEAIKELVALIVDDPTVIKQLAVMFLDDFRQKQQDDNPFDPGSVNYRAFQAGWFPAYVLIIIAVEVLITRGIGRGVSVASDATRLRTTLRSVRSQVQQSDRLPDVAAAVRRLKTDSSSPDGRVPEAASVTIPASATYTELVMTVLRAMRRFDQATDQLPTLLKGDSSNVPGRIAELDWGVTLLNLDRYGARTHLVTDASGRVGRLLSGETLVVYGAKSSWRDDVEFDHIAVRRNSDGELEIDEIWEVTKSAQRGASDTKRDEVAEALKKVQDDLESGAVSPDDTIGGIPARLFRDVDDTDTTVVGPRNGDGFDEQLDYDDIAYENTAEHIESHKDFYELE